MYVFMCVIQLVLNFISSSSDHKNLSLTVFFFCFRLQSLLELNVSFNYIPVSNDGFPSQLVFYTHT